MKKGQLENKSEYREVKTVIGKKIAYLEGQKIKSIQCK